MYNICLLQQLPNTSEPVAAVSDDVPAARVPDVPAVSPDIHLVSDIWNIIFVSENAYVYSINYCEFCGELLTLFNLLLNFQLLNCQLLIFFVIKSPTVGLARLLCDLSYNTNIMMYTMIIYRNLWNRQIRCRRQPQGQYSPIRLNSNGTAKHRCHHQARHHRRVHS